MSEIMLEHAPSDWPRKRLGHLFRERREKVNDKDFPPLSVTKQGIIPQLDTAAKTDDGDNRKGVRVGDFVINSRSDRKGSGGLSNRDGSVSLINIVLQPRGVEPRFAHHLLRSSAFQEEFYRWGHGIVADLWTTRYSEMKNILLAVPPPVIQKAIAGFLDQETAHIDRLIEKKQRLAALLGEKRSALIAAAMTGGIDPVSGQCRDPRASEAAEGGGEVIRLRHMMRIGPSPLEINSLDPETEVTFAPMDSLADGVGGLDTSRVKPISEVVRGSYKYFREGDVLLAKVTPCFENGKKAIAQGLANGVGYATSEVHVLRPNRGKIETRFLLYLLCSEDFRTLAMQSMTGASGLRRVSENGVLDYRPKIADLATQTAIADFLDRETARLDAVKTKTDESIALLRERRAALITAAVTGRIDVATWGKQGHSRPDRSAEVPGV